MAQRRGAGEAGEEMGAGEDDPAGMHGLGTIISLPSTSQVSLANISLAEPFFQVIP